MAVIKRYIENVEDEILKLDSEIQTLIHLLSESADDDVRRDLLNKRISLSGRLEELKLYRIIKEELPSDWRVLYDLNLVAKNNIGAYASTQIDFMVIVPGKGVVNLECKGGYYWDGTHFYASRGSNDEIDLVGQCFKADKLFNSYCLERTNLDRSMIGVYSHILVFPSFDYKGCDFCGTPAIDGPRLRNKGALESKIRFELENKMKGRSVVFPEESVNKIWEIFNEECIPGEMDCNTVHLDKLLEEMDRNTDDRSEDILDGIVDDDYPNWKIFGSAGTGKTMLAEAFVRKYHELHPEKRILFLCFNKLLAADLRIRFGESIPGLALANIHDVFSAKILSSELSVAPMNKLAPFVFDPVVDSREEISKKMLAAVDFLGLSKRRYDCVVIDEGQDFCRGDYALVNCLLHPKRKCVVFLSSEQKVYDGVKLFEDDWLSRTPFKTKVLRHNMRNSKMIHRYCSEISHDTETKSRVRYEGCEPVIENRKSLSDVYRDAIKKGFNNENIAILTDGNPNEIMADEITLIRPANDKVKELSRKLRDWRKGNGVWCGGLKGFKGLEAEYVIVVLAKTKTDWRDIYVACTRAKYRLVIMPGNTGIPVDKPRILSAE